MMRAAELAVGCIVSGSLILSGCNGKMPFNQLGSAATKPPPPSANPPAMNPAHSTPYVLAAECAGPFITFTVANMGNSELSVKKEDFALVVPGANKEVIPYNKQTDFIDLPANTVIPPQQIVKGRAKFKRSPAPVGNRLVFKPDQVGTYADIQTQVTLNPANPSQAASATQ